MSVKDYFGLIAQDVRQIAAGYHYNLPETIGSHYVNAVHGLNNPLSVQIGDYKFNYQNFGVFIGLYREVWCHGPYDIKIPREHPLIVDAGANIGLATLRLSKLNPSAHFICYEPQPDLYKLLLKNIDDNKVSAEAVNAALFSSPGTLSLYINDDAKAAASLYDYSGLTRRVEVPTVKLSDQLHDVDVVDLLKLDVEGAEVEIIRDLIDAGMIRRVRRIAMEFHELGGLRLMDFTAMLKKAGYRIDRLYDACATENGLICHLRASR